MIEDKMKGTTEDVIEQKGIEASLHEINLETGDHNKNEDGD